MNDQVSIGVIEQAARGDEYYELLAESVPHMVWIKTPDGAGIYLNERGVAFTGLSPDDIKGEGWQQLIDPEDVEIVRRGWERARRDGSDYAAEVRVRGADGIYHWMASQGAPMRAADGSTECWFGTMIPIDQRLRLQAELQETQHQMAETLTLLDTLQSTAPVGFLFVDREFRYVRINATAAAINGLSVEEHIGRTVRDVVPGLWPQIDRFYRRVLQSGEAIANVEMTGETNAQPGRLCSWSVSYYPVRVNGEVIGIGVVIVDITDRVEAEIAHSALTHAAVGAIAAAVEARDPYTAGHQNRVADIAGAIAGQLGMDSVSIEGIRLGAQIHDIGKLSVPSEILSKPSKLTPAEYELVKCHSRAGYEIVREIAFQWPVAQMILQHHERLDGSGYPDGLCDGEIIREARIVAVADVVEAMASHRPYRPARGIDLALKEVQAGRGRLFDPEVVDACVGLFREGHLHLNIA